MYLDPKYLLDSDFQFTKGETQIAQATRAEEAESRFVNWSRRAGYATTLADKIHQKGYDALVEDILREQVKQRTRRPGKNGKLNSWCISNLRHENWVSGLVDQFTIFETDSDQCLQYIYRITADRVFNAKTYYSAYNKCSQLGIAQCKKLAHFVYDAKSRKTIVNVDVTDQLAKRIESRIDKSLLGF